MNPIANKKLLWLFWLVLLLIAGGAAWYLSGCMRLSPWGFSDSATYLSAARNFAKGVGLGLVLPDGTFESLQIFAPFYSIVLSLFARFGLDLVSVSRFLDIFFFALLVFSSGWLFYRISESWLMALCFSLLIAMTPSLARDYTSMMSEPLAIVLGLLGFLLLLLAIKKESLWLLVIAGVLSGLSALTRYALIAVPVAGVVSILFLSRVPERKRLANGLIYGLLSGLPAGLWLLRQFLNSSNIGSRHYSLAVSLSEKITSFASHVFGVVKYWFPYRSNMIPGVSADVVLPILFSFILIIVAGGMILSITLRKVDGRQFDTWLLLFGFLLLAICYLGFLLVTYIVSTETISIDNRMLSPLTIMIYAVLLAGSLSFALKIHPRFAVPVGGVIITLFFVIYSLNPLQTYFVNLGKFPDGYASPDWKGLPIIAKARELPADRPVLSNLPGPLLFYNDQYAYYTTRGMQSAFTTVSLADQEKFKRLMTEECGAIVLFGQEKVLTYSTSNYDISPNDIELLRHLYSPIYDEKDGVILVDPQCSQ